MARPPAKSREDVVADLLRVFRTQGYEGSTLSNLSKATGLRRASLYHYFPKGKEDMAHAALDEVERIFRTEVLLPLADTTTDLQSRVHRVVVALDSYYEEGRTGCLLTALVLTPERNAFVLRVNQLFSDWIAAFASLASEAGISPEEAKHRAEDIVLKIQGALILSTATRDQFIFQRTLSDIPQAFGITD